MRLSGMIGRRRQTCPFRTCHTGLRSLSWKLSSNMVTRWDARTLATSTAREKRSHECSNYATRRKSQSSIISKVISTCRCKQLRHGWLQLKAKRTKQSICCGGRRIPKTYSASIPFRPERSFRFANNSALCCWKWGNQRKHSENLRLRSRSIPGRFRGLYGAAQAAELAGDNENASRYYTKLAAQTSKAGGSRDELNHVREFLSAQAKAADSNGVASARE